MTPDDWESWRSIRLQALTEAPYAFTSTHADWHVAPEERWRARLALEDSQNLVAYTDGVPVGMVTGVLADRGGAAALISMYVAPPVRGSGLADALIDGVEAWARGRAATALCLDVMVDNARARRLYERHGFTVSGPVARESPNDPLELRMCKPLRG